MFQQIKELRSMGAILVVSMSWNVLLSANQREEKSQPDSAAEATC